MGRELVTIQVGQCGNQVGRQFWTMALEEHAKHTKNGIFDESMSTFFRNVEHGYDLPMSQRIKNLRARAVLIDMEQGPVAETLNGPLGELFDSSQFLTDVSGSGNNWAHGYALYGAKYKEDILEKLRCATEHCDSLQSFFILHSMGGGTGSGLGTYILSLLEDHYPEVYRFTTAIFPSADDDVITSPYNSMLALHQLTEHADCVIPIENEALFAKVSSTTSKEKSFDGMNRIVARVLTHLTSSMRFEGSLNVDLNEITTNLVPYPKLHYLLSSLSPLTTKSPSYQTVRLSHLFNDIFHVQNQLIQTSPRTNGVMLACGLLFRGNVQISNVQSHLTKLKAEMKLIYWNEDGFKIGLCNVPSLDCPKNQPSVLALSNHGCIVETFDRMQQRFLKLYRRKAHVHHYTEYMEECQFDLALESNRWLIAEYNKLNSIQESPCERQLPQF
ncbi:tubulin epsilon chain isoform X3 [Thraustotheca clavata]|uniref:Tubulin epsilon chain isoform X3 n=1 Tax=Thraustotheca clavata TaxID=74557 RepID=A0A1W0A332_9STRA|nr:tubulin epsilon chain isoform X3 [Thraustotheca clavata]